jgi:hypothetical protein
MNLIRFLRSLYYTTNCRLRETFARLKKNQLAEEFGVGSGISADEYRGVKKLLRYLVEDHH